MCLQNEKNFDLQIGGMKLFLKEMKVLENNPEVIDLGF
jgi:hypothetical protein